MPKNMDYKDTYCEPQHGNIRYPSTAKKSVGGWAYVYTKDSEYVEDLSIYHRVQVRVKNSWVTFCGQPLDSPEIELPPHVHSESGEEEELDY